MHQISVFLLRELQSKSIGPRFRTTQTSHTAAAAAAATYSHQKHDKNRPKYMRRTSLVATSWNDGCLALGGEESTRRGWQRSAGGG
jgi:hypothetical protein